MGRKTGEDDSTKDFKGCKGRGQALKKGGEEDRQNHQALAQERKNLGGRQAKESGDRILQMDVDFSERRTTS
jgi:hypothetical protein